MASKRPLMVFRLVQPRRVYWVSLGPNGAGKSTTMKILTGYIPQTSGKVSVCGFDVETQALEVKRNIGYLPESNPLYQDMYVKESLLFIANIHRIEHKKNVSMILLNKLVLRPKTIRK